MQMKVLKIILIAFSLLVFSNSASFAGYDPLTRPNNKLGIHILFPSELARAATLVNSTGGEWGYVTIPIQYGDRDLEKWQAFMNDASKHKLIPIIRIATEPYHANTNVWRKPSNYDVIDFANFLDSLVWPTQNRYVLLFNETNRYDEWGGDAPAPAEYADFVELAADAFKSRSGDFFIIAGGLDNASPNDGVKYLDNLVYLRKMGEANPEAFKKIDGFSSHSYPNPNFAQAPSTTRIEGTSTYKYELQLVEKFAGKKMPVFITETGWNAEALPASVISSYYKIANEDIWQKDNNIIAVTPFLLESQGGGFNKFSFMKGSDFTEYGKAYKDLPKVKGAPVANAMPPLNPEVKKNNITPQKFVYAGISSVDLSVPSAVLKTYFKTMLGMTP